MAVISTLDELDVSPAILLDFAKTKKYDSRFRFTRSTNAYYVGQDGLLKYSRPNRPRIDHDPETLECLGLIRETGMANKIPYSNATTNWATEGLNTHANDTSDTLDPAGGTSAQKVVESTSTGPHRIYYNNVAVNSSGYSTWSIWLKPLPGNDSDHMITLESWYSGFSVRSGTFQIGSAGTEPEVLSVGGGARSAGIQKYANGWVRVWINFANQATTSRNFYVFSSRLTARDPTGETDHGFYWYGAQVESVGDERHLQRPTSYIATNGSALSRGDEVDMYMELEDTVEGDMFSSLDQMGRGMTFAMDARITYSYNNGTNYYYFSMRAGQNTNSYNYFGFRVGGASGDCTWQMRSDDDTGYITNTTKLEPASNSIGVGEERIDWLWAGTLGHTPDGTGFTAASNGSADKFFNQVNTKYGWDRLTQSAGDPGDANTGRKSVTGNSPNLLPGGNAVFQANQEGDRIDRIYLMGDGQPVYQGWLKRLAIYPVYANDQQLISLVKRDT